MRTSYYEKYPFVAIPGPIRECATGWDKIAAESHRAIAESRTEKSILVVDCYPGIDELAVLNEIGRRLTPELTIQASDAYHSPETIDNLVAPFLQREEPTSGNSQRLSLVNFFNAEPLWRIRRTIDELKAGLVLIVGFGTSLIAWGHILVYADLPRREARQRFHRDENGSMGADNKSLREILKEKNLLLVNECVSDRWKRPLISQWDYVLDTIIPGEPKMAGGDDVRRGLQAAARQPFRVTPCRDLDREKKKSGLPFDPALEENSVLFGFGDVRIEIPAINLIFNQPQALIGAAVHARFGDEFPIRLDFPDKTGLFEPLAHGDGWREESGRVHGIERRRHWFRRTVPHDTRGGVNILKLLEGDEAIVESPDHTFEPLIVHPGETFIVPAAVGRYDIGPHGPSAGKEIATIKAFVRT